MTHTGAHLAWLVLGAANGVARPALSSVEENGVWVALNDALGTSPIVWAALAIGFSMLHRVPGRPLRAVDHLAITAATILYLVPIATAAWIGLAVQATALLSAGDGTRRERAAAAILLAVALRYPVNAVALNVLAAPLLTVDASLVAGLLELTTGEGGRVGNIVIGPGGHRLLILTGCSSYTNLSLMLLAWFTATRALVESWRPHLFLHGMSVAAAVVGLNALRLVFMASGPNAYLFLHDGAGVPLFEGAVLVVSALLTIHGLTHGKKNHHHSVRPRRLGQPDQ
jgi:hypothetical protein